MKRRLTAIILVATMVMGLMTACASNEPEAEVTTPTETESTVEISTPEVETEPEVVEVEASTADSKKEETEIETTLAEETKPETEEVKEEVAETEKADAAETETEKADATETETETEKADTTETETKPETEVKEDTTTATASADLKYDLDRTEEDYWAQFGVYDWEYDTVLELTKNYEVSDEWMSKHGSYLKTGIASIDKPVLLIGEILGDAWTSGSWNKQKGLDPKNYYDFLSKCTNLTISPEEFIAQNNIVEVKSFDSILPGGIEITVYGFSKGNELVAAFIVSKK